MQSSFLVGSGRRGQASRCEGSLCKGALARTRRRLMRALRPGRQAGADASRDMTVAMLKASIHAMQAAGQHLGPRHRRARAADVDGRVLRLHDDLRMQPGAQLRPIAPLAPRQVALPRSIPGRLGQGAQVRRAARRGASRQCPQWSLGVQRNPSTTVKASKRDRHTHPAHCTAAATRGHRIDSKSASEQCGPSGVARARLSGEPRVELQQDAQQPKAPQLAALLHEQEREQPVAALVARAAAQQPLQPRAQQAVRHHQHVRVLLRSGGVRIEP